MSIYLDNAATTSVRREALEAMLPCFTAQYGNASSLHSHGRDARRLLEKARREVADALGAQPTEIYFTAGGSESDNWALRGTALALGQKGKHIITSAVEHHAVIHTAQFLEKQGFEVTYVPVDEFGRVNPADVERAIRPDTILVSIMAANNEVGTLEPIEEIGGIVKARGVVFHTDAVQAVGAVDVNIDRCHADMLSLSGHKFHGPKGVGALYIRKGTRLRNLIWGGAQERTLRAGTENIPGIVGMATALTLAVSEREETARRLTAMRDRMIAGILSEIPYVKLNGHPTERLPGNVNVSIRYIEGESLLMRLDGAGISASSGSACTSGSLDPSHVLLAMGLPHEVAHGSLRLTLGSENVESDVDAVLRNLPGIVRDLRALSPLYDDAVKRGDAAPL